MGIGNPGPKYVGTRHNVGFDTVERLAARSGAEFKRERFWNSLRARVTIGSQPVTLLKPLSYVNLSGPVVRKVAEALEVGRDRIMVVLDDFWLPVGRLRVRKQGGDGGHNGLESILRVMKSQRVPRLRIGIGEPDAQNAVNHVLKRFRTEEREVVARVIEAAADAVEVWVAEGIDAAMNRYNTYSPEGR